MLNCFFAILICIFASQTAPGQKRILSIDELYDPVEKIDFDGIYPAELAWLKDGRHYTEAGRRGKPLTRVDALTGDAENLFEPENLRSAFVEKLGMTLQEARRMWRDSQIALSPDEDGLMITWMDDLFYFQISSERLIRLTRDSGIEREASFSPSGERIAFVRNGDLYVSFVEDGREVRLTTGGCDEILNGLLDWIYQEEIYGRGSFKGFWWSPDSSLLAFLQLDESEVPEYPIVNLTEAERPVRSVKYPRAGEPNPGVRLGVISVSDGELLWVDLSKYQSTEFLIVRVGWTPDSRKVVFQVQDREQTWLELNSLDLSTGKIATLVRESSSAWVNVLDAPVWLPDGSFLWQSERTGFRHIYHYSAGGNSSRPVTSGHWEVRTLEAFEPGTGLVYFSGTRDSSLELHLYQVHLNGTGLTRLSEPRGCHKIQFSPGRDLFIDTWSDVLTPPKVRLCRADGSVVREIAANRVTILGEYDFSRPEFLQVRTRDGALLEAMMIVPPDFDPTQHYPVICHIYGGPHSPQMQTQRVINSWGGKNYLWHQMMAQRGYIIWVCDNRIASGKGAVSAWPAYKNLGEQELRDLEDALDWLKRRCFVDPSRIGLWGWSYGGFLTAYALTHSTHYKLGIAGAPVTDWRFYDSIYTERYMKKPENNPEGYKKSSVLKAAADLHGQLLLIHGGVDDNVHPQNTFSLVEELQHAGRQFHLMIYPTSKHGITDPDRLKHVREMMMEFILNNL